MFDIKIDIKMLYFYEKNNIFITWGYNLKFIYY